MDLRTPLGRARGLGSAKEGVSHWWAQRVTAVALVPLVIWFVILVIRLPHADYEQAITWLAYPINNVLLVLLLGCVFYHTVLGLQVVIEDYVHTEGLKIITLLVVKFTAIVLAASAIFAVLSIAFGG